MGTPLVDLFAWRFMTFPVATGAEEFGRLEPIVDLWRRKHTASGGLPAWRDFDLMDFQGWWGKLTLAEIDRAANDIKFVLWGTRLTDWWGEDFTHKRMIENSILKEPSYSEQIAYYGAVASGDCIGFNYGRIEDRYLTAAHAVWIDLPLSTNHGEPTHLFSAAELVDGEDVELPVFAL